MGARRAWGGRLVLQVTGQPGMHPGTNGAAVPGRVSVRRAWFSRRAVRGRSPTGRRLGSRSRVRAKEPVRQAMAGSFRPAGTRPHQPGNDTPALTWDFTYELNTGPSPRTGRGPRLGRRKTRLTCGAPLRNRTVDLLLTMDRCAVLPPQVDRLTCENAGTDWHSQAPDEPTRAPFATQSATHFDLSGVQADRTDRLAHTEGVVAACRPVETVHSPMWDVHHSNLCCRSPIPAPPPIAAWA